MQNSPPDPNVADAAPTAPILSGYDEQHLVTYLRLLDAAADGADWKEVARTVLHIEGRARAGSGAPGVGNPSRPCPLDHRAWLPGSAAGRGTALRAPTESPRPDIVPCRSPPAGQARRPGPERLAA